MLRFHLCGCCSEAVSAVADRDKAVHFHRAFRRVMSGSVVCRSMAELVLGFAKFGTALSGDSGFGILGETASVSAFPVARMTFT